MNAQEAKSLSIKANLKKRTIDEEEKIKSDAEQLKLAIRNRVVNMNTALAEVERRAKRGNYWAYIILPNPFEQEYLISDLIDMGYKSAVCDLQKTGLYINW